MEQTEIQAGDTESVKDKETAANPLQMIGVQLFKDDNAPVKSKKSVKRLARIAAMEVRIVQFTDKKLSFVFLEEAVSTHLLINLG